MRILLIFVGLISGYVASAQWKDFMISVRGDTLNRVDMSGKRQGPWVVHVDALRGEQGYDEQGYYEDDLKVGKWVRFSLMGDKIAEESYRWGYLDGRSKYYNHTGSLIREESWRAFEPGKAFDTVDVVDPTDPSRIKNRVVVKVDGKTMRHGEWKYYDADWGTVYKTEQWFMDSLKTGKDPDAPAAEVEDDLKPIDVGGNKKDKNESKKPQAILDYEKKNSGKKKVNVRDGRTGGN